MEVILPKGKVSMVAYVVKRIAVLIPVLLLVSLIIFSIMHLLPGDPVVLMLGGEGWATQEGLEAIREALGLNAPLHVQYWRFIWAAVHGDLGHSTRFKSEVASVIAKQFPYTLQVKKRGCASVFRADRSPAWHFGSSEKGLVA